MSYYALQSDKLTIKFVVGWDNPLKTFFFQKINLDKDPDSKSRINPWLGCNFEEISTVEDLLVHTNEHVQLPDEIITNLRQDQLNGGELTPLQKKMQELLKK